MESQSLSAAAVAVTGFGLSLSLIVAIGAQNMFVLRQGLRREHVGAIVALCAALDLALMTVGVAGIAAALGRHPALLDGLALAGAAFLAVYGLQAARRALRPQAMQAPGANGAQPLRRVLLQTLAITLLNPHVYLDTVLLVGAIGAQQPAALRPAFLAGAGLASGAWFTALGFAARLLAPVFARPAAWRVLDALVALTMWTLAALLVAPLAAR
jgi:L-lysine exporter family protein LysE/ArgO